MFENWKDLKIWEDTETWKDLEICEDPEILKEIEDLEGRKDCEDREDSENEGENNSGEWGCDEKNPWRYLDGWEALANAIILQAAEDYREARYKKLVKPKQEILCSVIMMEVEQFFLSNWFTWLTALNGEKLLERLKEESL